MAKIPETVNVIVTIKGNVNNHQFEYKAKGTGNPYEGLYKLSAELVGQDSLPFSFDILTTGMQYGFRIFTKYPQDMVDFFKGSFPQCFNWDRTVQFEDGGILNLSNNITYKDGTLYGDVWIHGANFPKNGPVMTKKVVMEEPSQETLYMRNGDLYSVDPKVYKLKDGTFYLGNFTTHYRSKNPNQVCPEGVHFIEHRLLKRNFDESYKKVDCVEYSAASVCKLPEH